LGRPKACYISAPTVQVQTIPKKHPRGPRAWGGGGGPCSWLSESRTSAVALPRGWGIRTGWGFSVSEGGGACFGQLSSPGGGTRIAAGRGHRELNLGPRRCDAGAVLKFFTDVFRIDLPSWPSSFCPFIMFPHPFPAPPYGHVPGPASYPVWGSPKGSFYLVLPPQGGAEGGRGRERGLFPFHRPFVGRAWGTFSIRPDGPGDAGPVSTGPRRFGGVGDWCWWMLTRFCWDWGRISSRGRGQGGALGGGVNSFRFRRGGKSRFPGFGSARTAGGDCYVLRAGGCGGRLEAGGRSTPAAPRAVLSFILGRGSIPPACPPSSTFHPPFPAFRPDKGANGPQADQKLQARATSAGTSTEHPNPHLCAPGAGKPQLPQGGAVTLVRNGRGNLSRGLSLKRRGNGRGGGAGVRVVPRYVSDPRPQVSSGFHERKTRGHPGFQTPPGTKHGLETPKHVEVADPPGPPLTCCPPGAPRRVRGGAFAAGRS